MHRNAGTRPSRPPARPSGPPSSARAERLRAAGLAWYAASGRSFAFRRTRDPYRILASEIILQQTQVSRGEPAWAAFVDRFPTFEALAAASPADVLRAWAGLGYNRRALHLHAAARAIVAEHGGRLPADLGALLALPGVGPYTARALLAICFGAPVAPVDTNVRRVITRLEGGATRSAAAVQAIADALVPPDRPAEWSAALMDIGATLCLPREPRCGACPLQADCRFARGGRSPAGQRAVPAAPAKARGRPEPYEGSRRWLRGRIVAELRALPDGAWWALDGPIGPHDQAAVEDVVGALVADGLVERDRAGRVRLPA